jgi:hypothetical protein
MLPRAMAKERFQRAIEEFDRMNAADPRSINVDGVDRPYELVQSQRLSAWVERLDPQASEALRLAARCQHLRRWEIPRSELPPGRAGYLQWRTRLARFHADESARMLRAAGYDEAVVDHVRRINLKQGLRSDPDVQTMEDALCLSFMEHELESFSEKHADDKIIEILRKTWKKMSARGHEAALALPLSPRLAKLVREALGLAN